MDRKQIRAIFEFVSLIDKELVIVFDEHNYYDYSNDRVGFSFDDLDDNGFLRHLREKHNINDIDLSLRMWSILHEIGHHFTWEDEFESEDEMYERYTYQHFPCENEAQLIAMQDAYFDMESEWRATEWAIDFARSNYEICKKYDRIIGEQNE